MDIAIGSRWKMYRGDNARTVLDVTDATVLVSAHWKGDPAVLMDRSVFEGIALVWDHDCVWGSVRNLGRCYNEYTCSVCGAKSTVDSSD